MTTTAPVDRDLEWEQTRRIVHRALRTSVHCSLATVNPDGSPHVTPIGSVMLTRPGQGLYFDVFNRALGRNLVRENRLCIQAVDAGKLHFLGGLLRGRFARPLGIRLIATAGPRREATPAEIERFQRSVGPLLRLKGGKAMWSNCRFVRDLTISDTRPIKIGSMTR